MTTRLFREGHLERNLQTVLFMVVNLFTKLSCMNIIKRNRSVLQNNFFFENFERFRGKHLVWSSFSIQLQGTD